MESLLILLL